MTEAATKTPTWPEWLTRPWDRLDYQFGDKLGSQRWLDRFATTPILWEAVGLLEVVFEEGRTRDHQIIRFVMGLADLGTLERFYDHYSYRRSPDVRKNPQMMICHKALHVFFTQYLSRHPKVDRLNHWEDSVTRVGEVQERQALYGDVVKFVTELYRRHHHQLDDYSGIVAQFVTDSLRYGYHDHRRETDEWLVEAVTRCMQHLCELALAGNQEKLLFSSISEANLGDEAAVKRLRATRQALRVIATEPHPRLLKRRLSLREAYHEPGTALYRHSARAARALVHHKIAVGEYNFGPWWSQKKNR